eukprot:369114-Pelagomonas_calceolata.AAC.2
MPLTTKHTKHCCCPMALGSNQNKAAELSAAQASNTTFRYDSNTTFRYDHVIQSILGWQHL